MIIHWAYFDYPEDWGKNPDVDIWVRLPLTRPCVVWKRHKFETNHTYSTQLDKVNCARCQKLPEFGEAKKRDGLRVLNDLDL